MVVVSSYPLAILLCVVTMLCWGSWANTQKLAQKTWRYELFYWDYVLGIFLLSLILAFTLGSWGDTGRSFLEDLSQARLESLANAFLGGVIFNAANILLVVAIAIAGMSVAFPVGIGIALVLGVLVNYIATPKGNATWLFIGVGLVALAIFLNAMAYRKKTDQVKSVGSKGILFSLAAGILMSLFYRFVASSMVISFESPEAGLLTPYSAVFIFSLGILASNFIFNTILMRKPINGEAVSFSQYFAGRTREHFTGILGGLIWSTGMSLSILAAGEAGYAISYGLGQGATLVAALWGVLVWREFRNVRGSRGLLLAMFITFVVGLMLIIYAGI